jgi:hypothetical protein
MMKAMRLSLLNAAAPLRRVIIIRPIPRRVLKNVRHDPPLINAAVDFIYPGGRY